MKPYFESSGVTLYCADARDALAAGAAAGVDLVLTDPPYCSGARRDAERSVRGSMVRGFGDEEEDWFSHDAMTTWGYSWFIRSLFSGLRAVLPQRAHIYVFSDWRQTPNVYGMLESCGYRVNNCLVWRKSHFGMGSHWRNQHENIVFASNGKPAPMKRRNAGTVLDATAVRTNRLHPTEKPLSLLAQIFSAAPGTCVLDPFAGSGSTLLAARDAGLRAVGFEIEERYCKVVAQRLSAPLADAA